MRKVFIAMFQKDGNGKWIIDDVFTNEESVKKYVEGWNDWEKSEGGNGDYWTYLETFMYEE